MKRHSGKREHACPRCPQSFVYIKELDRHMLGHKEERPFVCNIPGCGKAFKESYIFRLHMKRHDGTLKKRFVCTYSPCDKKFARRYTLERHILTHTGQKDYHCQYCEASYAQKNDLVKHLKIHVGDAIYNCTFDGCNAGFRLRAELKKHYAVHYNIVE